jgi:hypothetical protein
MYIKELIWIVDSRQEAELLVTDNQYNCLVFSEPCHYQKGDIIKEPLHAFCIKNFQLSEINELKIEHIEGYEHKCVAKILDIDKDLVIVGGIKIILDDWIPGWAKNGDIVYFECSRIDLW